MRPRALQSLLTPLRWPLGRSDGGANRAQAVNLLQNSELKGWPEQPIVFDNNGSQGYIEWPDKWVWVQREKIGHPPPESYHRDDGYEISAGSREWEAGYQQTIELNGGKNYRLRATFTPALYRYDDNPLVPTYLEWRYEIRGPRLEIDTPWTSGPLEKLKYQQQHEFEFKAPRSGPVEITFIGRGTAWDYIYKFLVHRLELEEPVKASTVRKGSLLTHQEFFSLSIRDDQWKPALASPTKGRTGSPVRAAPSMQAEPPVGRIGAHTVLDYLPDIRIQDLDGTPYYWLAVRSAQFDGWVRSDTVHFEGNVDVVPVQSAAGHIVQFAFLGSSEDNAALREAIAQNPRAFSDYAARFIKR